ncbi:hypothetical protein AAFF_G00425360 [Aldrovandia affinis]|uniref:Strawberry notch AAA domain-containing protein n=1 Tax=Aldrovandia affinis TaxID=143900 RepID=A0AAD7WZK3_9TELE|nr:hypothetical protein AAFF_G00425360 [Aldrovandia affinis]
MTHSLIDLMKLNPPPCLAQPTATATRKLSGNLHSGGVGAMEIVTMDMKLRGMYITRQLSFTGGDDGGRRSPSDTGLRQDVRQSDSSGSSRGCQTAQYSSSADTVTLTHVLGELRGPSSPPWIGPSSSGSSDTRGASPTEPTHCRDPAGLSGPTWTNLHGT